MSRHHLFFAAIVLAAGATYLVDRALPLGVAAGIPYIAVVVLCWWLGDWRKILGVAVLSSGLIVLGYFHSRPGSTDWIVRTNRFLALGALWATALMLMVARRSEQIRQVQDNILERMGEGVSFVSKHTSNLVYTNPRFDRMFGYEPNGLLGKHVSVVNAEPAVGTYQSILDSLATHGRWQGEVRNRRSNGSAFWSHAMVSELEHADYGSVWLSINQDISERVEIAQELKWKDQIVNHMFAGAVLVRISDGVIVYVNPRFESMFEYGRGELIGKNIATLNGGDAKTAAEKTDEIIESLVNTGAWSGEIRNRKKNGCEFWCLASVTVYTHPDLGEVGLGVQEDITDRKNAELEVQRINKELEQIVEERTRALRATQQELVQREKLAVLGQLAATVSHELRNPLSAIRNSAFLLSEQLAEESEGVGRSLDRITRNVDRCGRIIDDMLEYARLPQPVRDPLEFDRWLSELIDDYGLAASVTLDLRLGATGKRIRGDTERLRHVVLNLLDNACHAMQPERSGTVTEPLTLSVRTRTDNRSLILEVEDSGSGIAHGDMENIFEPLFSTRSFGVGLGLSIIRKIIELHGGTIDIVNRSGDPGVIATVEFPLV